MLVVVAANLGWHAVHRRAARSSRPQLRALCTTSQVHLMGVCRCAAALMRAGRLPREWSDSVAPAPAQHNAAW
jgi:hypothetical protein